MNKLLQIVHRNHLMRLCLAVLLLLFTFNTAYAQSTRESSPSRSRIDGIAIWKELLKSGIGSRTKIEIPLELLSKSSQFNKGKIEYNTSLTWDGEPFYFKQIDQTDRFTFSAMITGTNESHTYEEYVLALGPGTVCEIYGNVAIFGVKVSSQGNTPLVFVVYSPNGEDDHPRTVHSVSGKWTTEIGSLPFPDPLFWPKSTIFNMGSSPSSASGVHQYFLVYISGNGSLVQPDGSTITLSK